MCRGEVGVQGGGICARVKPMYRGEPGCMVKLLGWVYMGEAVYRGEFGVHG